MFLDPAENLSSPTRQEADELAERVREWGDHADTLNALHLSAAKTLAWLKDNRVPEQWLRPDRRYSKLSDPDEVATDASVQWWPTPLRHEDAAIKEARNVLLRQRAYDLGLLYFLRALASAGRIEISNDDLVDEVLLPSSYFGFNQLLAFARLKAIDRSSYDELCQNPRKSRISAAAVAELFGITSEHRSILFRKKLVRFGSLGLVSTSKGHGDGLAIELGPTGATFFVEVYVPIINHMPLQKE